MTENFLQRGALTIEYDWKIWQRQTLTVYYVMWDDNYAQAWYHS